MGRILITCPVVQPVPVVKDIEPTCSVPTSVALAPDPAAALTVTDGCAVI